MGRIIGIPKWHNSAKQWREGLPTSQALILGKVRGEATNSFRFDDKNEDDQDHDDIAWSEEQDESDDDDCSVSVLPKPGEASLSDIEDYGPYWSNSSVHTIPGSSFRLNFEYLRFSWFILLGFLFFSSGFSLIVSFVFKPPLISKYFAYYLPVIGKKILQKHRQQHRYLLVTVYMFKCFYQCCLLMTFSNVPFLKL